MAINLQFNGVTVSLANSETGWSGQQGNLDNEVFVQGTGSYTYQTGKNSRSSCTYTPPSAVNGGGAGYHLYFYMRCDVFPFAEAISTGTVTPSGLTVRVTTGAGNFREWHVSGSDVWDGSWKSFALNLSNTTALYASGGTFNAAAISQIEWFVDNSNSGNIRVIDNTWLDAVRVGRGIYVDGIGSGDPAYPLADIEAIANSTANKYGIIENIDGVLFVQGELHFRFIISGLEINSENEVVVFREINVTNDTEYGNDNFRFLFDANNAASCSYDFKNLTMIGPEHKYNRPLIETIGNSDVTFDGLLLNRGGATEFNVGTIITNSKFVRCGLITPNTATMTDCSISDATKETVGGIASSLLYPPTTDNLTNIQFLNSVTAPDDAIDADIEIDSAGTYTFDGHQFTNSPVEAVNNTSGTTVTVNLVGGSNASTYSGTLVNFVASYTHELTGLVQFTEVTYVLVSNGNVVFNVEDVDGTGTTTYTHGGGEQVDVLIHHVDYQPDISNIYGITLPNADASVKIQQFDDLNYENPP